MSWRIVAEVYKAKLGSLTRKAIAAKMADWADHDGCGIYPSVQRVADETETSVRTVQYTLRALATDGLLIKVRNGGKGPRSTSEYRFDLKALAALPRSRQLGGEKGATGAPLDNDVRVQPRTKRVQPTAFKGASVAPEPNREPSVEPERRKRSLKGKRQMITLPPGWELPDEDRHSVVTRVNTATRRSSVGAGRPTSSSNSRFLELPAADVFCGSWPRRPMKAHSMLPFMRGLLPSAWPSICRLVSEIASAL